MIPLIPILAGLAVLGGGATFVWYDSLSGEDKKNANRLTGEYARSLFGKAVDQLTPSEVRAVHDRVKAHFLN
jgi:hypothetical protein